jgi:HEAT repeat protein
MGKDGLLPSRFFEEPKRSRLREVRRLAGRTPSGARGAERIATWFEGGDPTLIQALTAVVTTDSDRSVRRAAYAGLARIPDRAAIPGLLTGLSVSDRASRAHAVMALGRLAAREAVPGLVALLGDPYCRLMAGEALVEIRDESALEPLKRAAAHGLPWRRRRLRVRVEELAAAVGARPETTSR